MDEDDAGQRLRPSPGIVAALIVGLAAALVAAILPTWRLEALILDLGLPTLLPPAAPPLGHTARGAVIVLAGGVAGLATWLAAERLLAVPGARPKAPRRADAHPDAPARAPVKAMRDLGTPFLDVAAPPPGEQPLPHDLDMPMATFDPAAVPEAPMTPSAAVSPLYRPTPPPDPVVERVPPVRPVLTLAPEPEPEVAPPVADARPQTIDRLLERLEDGLRRRGRKPAADLPSEALATLKELTAPRARTGS